MFTNSSPNKQVAPFASQTHRLLSMCSIFLRAGGKFLYDVPPSEKIPHQSKCFLWNASYLLNFWWVRWWVSVADGHSKFVTTKAQLHIWILLQIKPGSLPICLCFFHRLKKQDSIGKCGFFSLFSTHGVGRMSFRRYWDIYLRSNSEI